MNMLIDGEWRGASDGAVDPVLNPATGEEIAIAPRAPSACWFSSGIHDTLHEMTKEKTLLLHEVFGPP